MTTPIFPVDLPIISSMNMRPVTNVIADEDGGNKDFRRRSRVPGANDDVEWLFLEDDYKTFEDFRRLNLLGAHKWFWIQLPSAGGVTWHVARFAKKPKATAVGHRAWKVSAELEVRERAFSSQSIEGGSFVEDFSQGLTPYTVVFGTLDSYTVPDGTLHCASQNSGTARRIRRTFDPVVASQISGEFRLDSLGTDDAIVIEIKSGTTTHFHFNPRREGAYDSPRRAIARMGGSGSIPVTDASIQIGIWYRMTLSVVPGAGNSTCTIARIDNGLILKTTSFPGDFTAVEVDAMEFLNDSGSTTSATRWDNIQIRETF